MGNLLTREQHMLALGYRLRIPAVGFFHLDELRSVWRLDERTTRARGMADQLYYTPGLPTGE